MKFPEKGYKAKSIANNSTLIGWSSAVTAAERVEGWIHSSAAVTVELWALRPATNPNHLLQGDVVATADLGTDWRLVEGPLEVAADATEPYSWSLAPCNVRLLVHNASGGAATVDLEVNTRN